MTVKPKLIRLIDSLREATRQDRVQWEGRPDLDSISIRLERVTVSIDEEPSGGYTVTVLNAAGDAHELKIISPQDPDYLKIDDLYKLAVHSALGSDDLLDQAIADVESLKVS